MSKDIFSLLLHSYSSYIQMPILLANPHGEFKFKINTDDVFLNMLKASSFYKDIVEMGQTIGKPTVVTSYDETLLDNKFILSPLLNIDEEPSFILAGPFFEQPCDAVDSGFFPPLQTAASLSREKSLIAMEKVKSLISILSYIKDQKETAANEEKTIHLLKYLHTKSETVHGQREFLSALFDQILQTEKIDFLGCAVKNESDIFFIDLVKGKGSELLSGNFFFIGEGLLGQSVAMEKKMVWENIRDLTRANYFHQLEFFPADLFCFPVRKKGKVESVFFGGTLSDSKLDKKFLQVVESLLYFAGEKNHLAAKLKLAEDKQIVSEAVLDWITVLLHSADLKNTLYTLLDFCQTLNKGKFSCFTSMDGQYFSRGEAEEAVRLNHKQKLETYRNRTNDHQTTESETQTTIHQPVFINGDIFGLLTIELDADFCLADYAVLIHTMCQLIGQSAFRQPANQAACAIELLHDSMSELNEEKYALTLKAVELARILSNEIPLLNAKELMGACKVIVYKVSFLRKKIPGTIELEIVEECDEILSGKTSRKRERIEAEILAFLYKVFIQKETPASSAAFLKPEWRDFFVKAYSLYTSTKERPANQENIEKDIVNVSEVGNVADILDIQSVIDKLSLTAREKEILYLILEGMNNYEVGSYLNISSHTVKNHITNIFKKMNVTDRMQAMVKIYRIKYGEE